MIISSLTERTEAQGFCSESLRGGFRANCHPADAGNGDDIVEDGIIILLYTPKNSLCDLWELKRLKGAGERI